MAREWIFPSHTWWNSSAWLMDPQLVCFLMGEKRFRPKTRLRQRRMATAEKRGLTTNIMVKVPAMPKRQVCQLKYLKEGRKLGAEAQSRPRQATLMEA